MHTVAVLGSLPPTIPATEFTLPEKGMDALVAEIEQCRQEIITCEETLKKASIYDASFQVQMLKAQNEENYSSASETSEHDEDFVWISGYLPETDLPKFKAAATKHQWAWAMDDVTEDDTELTLSAKLTPAVDFQHLSNVLVIKQLKEDMKETGSASETVAPDTQSTSETQSDAADSTDSSEEGE